MKPKTHKISEKDADRIAARVASDLRVLIESTFYVLDKDSNKVPLLFNDAQNTHWPKITSRDIILKSRKLGFTTIRLARIIAKCATMKNRKCIVVSLDDDATHRTLGRAVEMIKNCAIDLGAKVFNETIKFPKTNSSIWIGTAGSKTFGRGDDITDYLLTEFFWWQNASLLTGIEEGCVNDSEGAIESTGYGFGSAQHKLWLRAQQKKPGLTLPDGAPRLYTPHFFPWFDDPTLEVDCQAPLKDLDQYEAQLRDEFKVSDRKLLWRRLKLGSMFDPNLFPQEYPATPEEAFLVSGLMVFDAMALQKHEKTARKALWVGEIRDHGHEVKLDPDERGRLTIWLTPDSGALYVISGDVAAGTTEGAFSVADVFDVATHEQVAQWRGHTAPETFGDILTMLGAYYNFAHLAPEVNNHGLTTCVRVQDNEYPNLYRRDDGVGGTSLGWYTSPGKSGTRILLIDEARSVVRNFTVKINSPQTIAECRTFITLPNDDMGHQGGSFQDCVITLGIGACMLKKHSYVPEERKAMFQERLGFRKPHVGMISKRHNQAGGYR